VLLLGLALLTALVLLSAAVARADEARPALEISSLPTPTHFSPGDTNGRYAYEVRVANLGAAPTDGSPIEIIDSLPAGLVLEELEFLLPAAGGVTDAAAEICTQAGVGAVTVTCTVPEELPGSGEESARLEAGEEWLLSLIVSPAGAAEGEALVNEVAVAGGGADPVAASSQNLASSAQPAPGVAEFSAAAVGSDGLPATRAGATPYAFDASFALNTRAAQGGEPGVEILPAGGDLKDLRFDLPPGLVADPGAVPRCSAQQFSSPAGCPDSSAIGFLVIRQLEAGGKVIPRPLYNLEPPPGMPAQFGLHVAALPVFVNTTLRPGDHGLTAFLPNLTQSRRVTAIRLELWGDPADPRHDPLRGSCLSEGGGARFSLGSCTAESSSSPFYRLPTSCEEPLLFRVSFDTWPDPGAFHGADSSQPAAAGCSQLPFQPTSDLGLSSEVSDSPSGLAFNLQLPDGSSDLRRLSLSLPPGLVLNPATANGLAACSPEQIGLQSAREPSCPDAARLGGIEVRTPLLDRPLGGSLYLASPYKNPFDSLFAVYVVIDDPESGTLVKLPGEIEADPGNGQLRVAFDDLPQLPLTAATVELAEGPRAALRTPSVCGRYESRLQLDPYSHGPGEPANEASSSIAISRPPASSSCATPGSLPNAPDFLAGALSPLAASSSPFVLELKRGDGSQEFQRLDLDLPPGLAADLTAVPVCAPETFGGVAARIGSDCAASRIGSVELAAGAGPLPLPLRGAAYLAGPHRGAPFSLLLVVPALVGPFDLGTLAVRASLAIDPETARIRIASDPLPAIRAGIPLDLRTLRVELDRPGFVRAPTGCKQTAIGGAIESTQGNLASLHSRFRLRGCSRLGLRPRVHLRVSGGLGRNAHPRIDVDLVPRAGDANLATANFTLPAGELLDLHRIRALCARSPAAGSCPRASRLGHVRLLSPLLPDPLQGPIYLRAPSDRYPDLIADLRGANELHLLLHGSTATAPGGRFRVRFTGLPDLPMAKASIALSGGRRGIVVNSEGLCARPRSAAVGLSAHNGKQYRLRPSLRLRGRC
jgi:hypothetical protein